MSIILIYAIYTQLDYFSFTVLCEKETLNKYLLNRIEHASSNFTYLKFFKISSYEDYKFLFCLTT